MRKNIYSSAVAILAVGTALFLVFAPTSSAAEQVQPGDVIKGEGQSTVYYLGEDEKRYVFPNGKTYFSWFEGFDHVKEISNEELMSYPLAGNVRYKPGSLLVKIQTDPKVYAVGENGKLRWVKNERVARGLYGQHWNKLVDDVPDSFFVNYNVGDPVEGAEDFDPVEAENKAPGIGHNLGLKARKQAQKRTEKAQARKCKKWQKVTNRLQKRLHRWGQELPEDIGEEYLNECVGTAEQNQNQNQNQNRDQTASGTEEVTICHMPPGNPAAAHTITVAKPALRAHLGHGDTIGACAGDDEGSEEEKDEEADDEESDEEEGNEEETDTTSPVIADLEVDAGTTTATVNWTTDEDADSLVTYAAESLDKASTTESVSDDSLTQEHSLELTDLASSTIYYFVVESADEAGNIATSSEEVLETL